MQGQGSFIERAPEADWGKISPRGTLSSSRLSGTAENHALVISTSCRPRIRPQLSSLSFFVYACAFQHSPITRSPHSKSLRDFSCGEATPNSGGWVAAERDRNIRRFRFETPTITFLFFSCFFFFSFIVTIFSTFESLSLFFLLSSFRAFQYSLVIHSVPSGVSGASIFISHRGLLLPV